MVKGKRSLHFGRDDTERLKRGEVIERRLRALKSRRVVWDSVALVLFSLAMAGALLLLIVSLFWSGWVMAVLLVPVGLLAWRLVAQNRFWNVARLVEESFPEVRGKLVAAVQLARWGGEKTDAIIDAKIGDSPSERSARGTVPVFAGDSDSLRDSPRFRPGAVPVLVREGYSEEMIDAAVVDVEKAFAPLPLGRLVNRRRVLWAFAALALMAVCFGALARVSPARVRVGISNAFARSAEGVAFEVQPGDTAVMPGGSVVLRARVSPSGVFRSVRLVRSGKERDTRVLKLSGDTCRISLAAGHGFEYRFRVLGQSSDPHRVRVLESLSLERLVFTLRPPAYSGLPEVRSSGLEVSGLKGTVVGIEGEANRLMSAGRVVLGNDTLAITINPQDSSAFEAEFTIKGDATGAIELADNEDKVLQPATEVRVRAIADEPPFVKLFGPGRDIDLPVSMRVLLGINSLDDFGLRGLYLHYGEDSIDQRVRLKSLSGRREDTTLYAWDLSDANLLPGEAIQYYVSVTDNDVVSGPKAGRTETFVVRFPTMTEIYNAAVRQTERTESELGPMKSEQAQLGEELRRLSDEMKKSRELSWEEKQALEKVLGGQEGLMGSLGHDEGVVAGDDP